MTHPTLANQPLSGPIDPDWTIDQLLDQLADPDALGALPDRDLARDLARIETAASRTAGAPPWRRDPAPVALIRSLAALSRSAPALRAATLRELLTERAARPTRDQLAIS